MAKTINIPFISDKQKRKKAIKSYLQIIIGSLIVAMAYVLESFFLMEFTDFDYPPSLSNWIV